MLYRTLSGRSLALKPSVIFPEKGMLYLVIYGLLQALYVQQDGLESMVRAFAGSESYKIESEPEAVLIRRVRHDAIGHPTKQGGTKGKTGKSWEQVSHHIVQHSMSTRQFTLLRASNLTGTSFIDVNITDLIAKNRALAVRVLARIKRELEQMEMEHRNAFKDEKLAALFSDQLGYFFEKLFSAIHSPSYGNSPMGEIGLEVIVETVSKFRASHRQAGVPPELLRDGGHR